MHAVQVEAMVSYLENGNTTFLRLLRKISNQQEVGRMAVFQIRHPRPDTHAPASRLRAPASDFFSGIDCRDLTLSVALVRLGTLTAPV